MKFIVPCVFGALFSIFSNIANSQSATPTRPKIGQIIYEGIYSGESVKTRRRSSSEQELEGAITITVNFNNDAVRASYTTTGLLRSNRVTGLLQGDVCKLYHQNGGRLEGECTATNFDGVIQSSPSDRKKIDVSFQAKVVKIEDFAQAVPRVSDLAEQRTARTTSGVKLPEPETSATGPGNTAQQRQDDSKPNMRFSVADPSLISAADQSAGPEEQAVLAAKYIKAFEIPRGLALMELSSSRGNHKASNTLGMYYENGSYVRRDVARATGLYELAASQGSSNAAWNLGVYYAADTPSRDDTSALKWFQQAAKLGDKDASASYSRLKNGYSLVIPHAGREPPKPYAAEKIGSIAQEALPQYEGRSMTQIINGRNMLGHAGIDPGSLTATLSRAGIKGGTLQYSSVIKHTFKTSAGITSGYTISFCTKGKGWCVAPFETAEAILTIWPFGDGVYVNMWMTSVLTSGAGRKPFFCQLKDSYFWCNQHVYPFSSLANLDEPLRIVERPSLPQDIRMGFADSAGASVWVDKAWESLWKAQDQPKSSNGECFSLGGQHRSEDKDAHGNIHICPSR